GDQAASIRHPQGAKIPDPVQPANGACPRSNRAVPRRRGAGSAHRMSGEVEIERALAAITATLNDQQLEHLDAGCLQEIVDDSLGGERKLTVDDGGGLHDETGARIGAIRRTDSGEWITERQNPEAARSGVAVPSPPPQGKLRSLLTKAKVLGP